MFAVGNVCTQDDVEAFVLQLQGRKRWRVYAPAVELASSSSGDLNRSTLGLPLIDAVLEPGDMLYMPRGTIHEASTALGSNLSHCVSAFSTHVTLSTYQQQAWAPLLERALCAAVQQAEAEMVQVRGGVPIGGFRHLGIVHQSAEGATPSMAGAGGAENNPRSSDTTVTRQALQGKAHELLQQILRYFNASLDCAADDMAADFVQARMPPRKTIRAQDAQGPRRRKQLDKRGASRSRLIRFREVDSLRLVSCLLTGGATAEGVSVGQGQGAEGVRLLTSRYVHRL